MRTDALGAAVNPRRLAVSAGTLLLLASSAARADGEPLYSASEYADDLSHLAPRARELEQKTYSYCVRTKAVYECLSYDGDGSVQKTRKEAVAHGTAFAYKQDGATTLLMTNEHVAEWPAVTGDGVRVDGVPAGCKRVSESLQLVDSENDRYQADDIALTRVVSDPQLDAAIVRAKVTLPVLPWKLGRSAALRDRNVVEVRGFPLGAFAATNEGKVISAFDHDDERNWDHDDFVIDALLSAGNSGSPVLAVSNKTGEFELVGIFHAGYTEGSALNVVVGIDQLRDLMTTLKRAPRSHAETPLALDEPARAGLLRQLMESPAAPFFPFGPLVASVQPRSDGALVYELFPRDFPFHATPLFAFEDLRQPGSFGNVGRVWFGDGGRLRAYRRDELDGEAQAGVERAVDGLRRDAVAFMSARAAPLPAAATRPEFDRAARLERSLQRTVAMRRTATTTVGELADRLAPKASEPAAQVAELFTPALPASLAAVTTPATPSATK